MGKVQYTYSSYGGGAGIARQVIEHANYGGVDISPSIPPGGYPLIAALTASEISFVVTD